MSVIVLIESGDGLSRELVMPAAPMPGDAIELDGARRVVTARTFRLGGGGEMRLVVRVSRAESEAR